MCIEKITVSQIENYFRFLYAEDDVASNFKIWCCYVVTHAIEQNDLIDKIWEELVTAKCFVHLNIEKKEISDFLNRLQK